MVHNIGFCGCHFFAKKEIEDVLFDVDRNELFSSVPIHQSFEVSPHSQAKFAVHWNHETTVRSQIEILTSFTRDLSSTAKIFVYTRASSVQRSAQAIFNVALKIAKLLRQEYIHRWLFDRIFHSPAPSGLKFNLNVFTVSSCVQVHFHPFDPGLLMAPRSKLPSESELSQVSSQPSYQPTELQASTRQNSSHHQTKMYQCKICQRDARTCL